MYNPIADKRYHHAIVSSRNEITPGVFEMVFNLEKPITYKSGQYLWLELPTLTSEDPKGNRRAFSILNPPTVGGKQLHILFRKGSSGYKQTLEHIPLESVVRIHAPFGSAFLLPEDKDAPLVLLSAGTGIAPFLCLMRTISPEMPCCAIHLFHYDTSEETVPYKSEIDTLNSYRVQSHTLFHPFTFEDLSSVTLLQDARFFISGPQKFIDESYKHLVAHGIKPSQLSYEALYPTPTGRSKLNVLLDSAQRPEPTDNKELESFLQNQIFRAALDKSSNHIVVTDTNGVIYYANASAEKITGYTRNEIIGNTPRLWGGLMNAAFYKRIWEIKIQSIPVVEEITNRRKNGDLYIVIVHISPISDAEGNLIGFLATEEDITKLRLRERELATLSNHFILATTSANIATWEWDILTDSLTSDTIFNKLYEQDLKTDPRGAFIAWQSALIPEDKERTTTELQAILQDPKKNFDLKYRIVTPSGLTKTLRAVANVQRDENGKAMKAVGVNWDITHEEEVDRIKTEFISLASHELRGPVTAIRWYTDILANGSLGALNEKQRECLQTIHQGNLHLIDLIETLLDVSRIELGKFTLEMGSIDLKQLIETILTELKPKSEEKKITITTQFTPGASSIRADAKFMRILFQNLISNAIKYNKDHGSVACSVGFDAGKKHLVVTMKDTGVGIPKDEQPFIFRKMYRASNIREHVSEGTGLGLYLTKSILEHTGGTIQFESTEQVGSTFTITFPVEGMIAA